MPRNALVASLPLMLGLARADAAIEIARQRLKMAEQRTLLEQDLSNDAMKAGVMLWPLRQWRERARIDTDLPPQTRDAVNAGH